jgi:hypothetical protein
MDSASCAKGRKLNEIITTWSMDSAAESIGMIAWLEACSQTDPVVNIGHLLVLSSRRTRAEGFCEQRMRLCDCQVHRRLSSRDAHTHTGPRQVQYLDA